MRLHYFGQISYATKYTAHVMNSTNIHTHHIHIRTTAGPKQNKKQPNDTEWIQKDYIVIHLNELNEYYQQQNKLKKNNQMYVTVQQS